MSEKEEKTNELKVKFADLQIARENLAFQLREINDEMARIRIEMQKQGG